MLSNAMRPMHFARLALQRASADRTTCCWQAAEEGEGDGEPVGTDRGYCLGDDSPGVFAEGIMQFAIWLVGLMCHLSALVRDTLQYRLHPKQGSVLFWFMGDTVEGVLTANLRWCPLWGLQDHETAAVFTTLPPLCVPSSTFPGWLVFQKASSSSCHRMKSSRRSVWMTSENHSPTNCTTGGDGEV